MPDRIITERPDSAVQRSYIHCEATPLPWSQRPRPSDVPLQSGLMSHMLTGTGEPPKTRAGLCWLRNDANVLRATRSAAARRAPRYGLGDPPRSLRISRSGGPSGAACLSPHWRMVVNTGHMSLLRACSAGLRRSCSPAGAFKAAGPGGLCSGASGGAMPRGRRGPYRPRHRAGRYPKTAATVPGTGCVQSR